MNVDSSQAPGYERTLLIHSYYAALDRDDDFNAEKATLYAALDLWEEERSTDGSPDGLPQHWEDLRPFDPLRTPNREYFLRTPMAYGAVVDLAVRWHMPSGIARKYGHGSGPQSLYRNWRSRRVTGHDFGIVTALGTAYWVPQPSGPIVPNVPLTFWWDPLHLAADAELEDIIATVTSQIAESIRAQADLARAAAKEAGWRLDRSREELSKHAADFLAVNHPVNPTTAAAFARKMLPAEEPVPDALTHSYRIRIQQRLKRFRELVRPL